MPTNTDQNLYRGYVLPISESWLAESPDSWLLFWGSYNKQTVPPREIGRAMALMWIGWLWAPVSGRDHVIKTLWLKHQSGLACHLLSVSMCPHHPCKTLHAKEESTFGFSIFFKTYICICPVWLKHFQTQDYMCICCRIMNPFFISYIYKGKKPSNWLNVKKFNSLCFLPLLEGLLILSVLISSHKIQKANFLVFPVLLVTV